MSTADDFKDALFAMPPADKAGAYRDPWQDVWKLTNGMGTRSVAELIEGGWVPVSEPVPTTVTEAMVTAGHRAWMDSSTFASPSDKVHAVITAALRAAPPTDVDARPGPQARAAFQERHAPAAEETVRRVAEAMWMHSEEPGTWDEASDDWLALARVALNATPAPTTDEAHDIDWQAVAERQEADAETVTRALDEARAFAARWKETARHINRDARKTLAWLVSDHMAENRRIHDARIEALARADEAEQERDHWKREADGANDDLTHLRGMTAREHLDAARAARETGYPLPKGATIPAGVRFWVKAEGEPWEFVPDGTTGDLDTSPFPAAQYVTVDPPTPKRPEWADLAGVFSELDVSCLVDLDDLARQAHEHGVRVTEDGEGER